MAIQERSIPIARPMIGEAEVNAVIDVLRSGNLVQGEVVARFERRFASMIGVRHAVAVSSGTAALHIALLAHGVGAEDEVITSSFSFAATANAVLYTGARPVFVDIDPRDFNLDPNLVEARIGPRTRAILPVHLYGQPADMDAICAIAARHGLAVIEDAAQAHGAALHGRSVGTFGTACFSFYATKNVVTGEGGVVTTDDDQLAERLRMLRSHGARVRYQHEILGFNYRMTDLQAAIGEVQLERLSEFTERRIANAEFLSANLKNVIPPRPLPGRRHVFHQYTVRVQSNRDAAVGALAELGVGTGVHYPRPIHRQPLYLDLGYTDSLPLAEQASREVLSLPVYPALEQWDLERIVEAVSGLSI
jgi:dTDP-4-amino-4,6-dideoxygalactose transaminase